MRYTSIEQRVLYSPSVADRWHEHQMMTNCFSRGGVCAGGGGGGPYLRQVFKCCLSSSTSSNKPPTALDTGSKHKRSNLRSQIKKGLSEANPRLYLSLSVCDR